MHPELTSTGLYVSAIAADLARTHLVGVLCGRPTYAARGMQVPRTETWRGVAIRRCVGTTFDKNRMAGRVMNMLTLTVSIGLQAVRACSRNDVVFVVTNPPTLPYVVGVASWVRGCRYVVMLHDVYPDTLVAVTGLSESSLIVRAGRWLNRHLLNGAEAVVAVGRDMREAIGRRHPAVAAKTTVIPNWGETESVRPGDRSANPLLESLGLMERFVVLCAGNMGRPNDISTIVDVARRLREDAAIHFLFVGDGVKLPGLREAVQTAGLDNVTILGARPRAEQPVFLNACDVGIVPLVGGMKGVAVPSRLYNLMAAGKPILALTDEGSEVDLVVREEDIGWVVRPGDVDSCVAAIREAASDRSRLEGMGLRARSASERRFSASAGLAAYRALVRAVPGFEAGD